VEDKDAENKKEIPKDKDGRVEREILDLIQCSELLN